MNGVAELCIFRLCCAVAELRARRWTEDKHEDNDAGGYGKFEFALIGDTPYRDVAQFENVLGYGDACEGEAGSEKDACKRQPPQQDEKK